MHLQLIGRGCLAAWWWIRISLDTPGWRQTSDGYPNPVSELLLNCSISDLHAWGTNREEALKPILTAFLFFRFLGALLGSKFLCVDKMPPASPGPIQTEASQYMKVTKALLPIVFVGFFCCSFCFTPSFPLVLDHFHPLCLTHYLIVRLFSLCMFSLPSMFTFVSRLLFLFNSPWFALDFSVLLIFSEALPFSPLTFHPGAPLGPCFQLGLFCLVYWTFALPYVAQQPPFFLCPHPPTLLIRSQEATSSLLLVLFIYVFFFPQEIE